MARNRTVTVELVVDEDGAVRGFKRADGAAQDFGDSLDDTSKRSSNFGRNVKLAAAAAATAIGAMAVRAGRHLFELGMSMEETADQFNTVFGDAAEGVDQFIEDFGRLAGFTETEGRKVTAQLGALAQGFGLNQEASADFSQQVVRLAADISSFNEIPFEEALSAIRSGLVGEVEPLRRFGIDVSAAAVNQRALARSTAESAEELSQQEKVLARLELAYEGAGKAVGDVERTQDSTARQVVQLRRDFRQLQEDLAEELMPVFRDLVDEMNTFAEEEGDTIAEAVREIGGAIVELTEALSKVPGLWRDIREASRIDLFGGQIRPLEGPTLFGLLMDPSRAEEFFASPTQVASEGVTGQQERFDPDARPDLGGPAAGAGAAADETDRLTRSTSELVDWMEELGDEAGVLEENVAAYKQEVERATESTAQMFESVRFQDVMDETEAELQRLDQLIETGVVQPQQRAAEEARILEGALTQMVDQGVDLTRTEVGLLRQILLLTRMEMEKMGGSGEQAIQAFTHIRQGVNDILRGAGLTPEQISRLRQEMGAFGQISRRELMAVAREMGLTEEQTRALERALQQLRNRAEQLASAMGRAGADLVGVFRDGKVEAREMLNIVTNLASTALKIFGGGPLASFASSFLGGLRFAHGTDGEFPGIGIVGERGPEAIVAPPYSSIITNQNLRRLPSAVGVMQGAQAMGRPAAARQAVDVRAQTDVSVTAQPSDWFDVVAQVRRHEEIIDELT